MQFEIKSTADPGVFEVNAKLMGVAMDKVDLIFQVGIVKDNSNQRFTL